MQARLKSIKKWVRFFRPHFATVHSWVQIKKGALLQYIFQSSHFINNPALPFDIPHLTHISFNMTIIEAIVGLH